MIEKHDLFNLPFIQNHKESTKCFQYLTMLYSVFLSIVECGQIPVIKRVVVIQRNIVLIQCIALNQRSFDL